MRLFISFIILLLSAPAMAADYYFSNAGNNSNPGTASQPFNNISKLSSLSYGAGDRFFFKGGDRFYGSAPTFNSGTLGNEIVFESYGGGKAIFNGFTSLNTWSNAGGNIWTASLSAGSSENVVISNGVQVAPGRFPNTGWLTMSTAGGADNNSTFTTTTGTPSAYTGANAVIRKREWIIDKVPITSISFQTINFSNVNEFPARNNWGFFFTDHPTTLDVQGEWYYNPVGTLSYYSTVNPATLNVKAATLDAFANISGKNYLRFQNIIFEGFKGAVFNISSSTGIKIIGCEGRFANKFIDANYLTSSIFTGNNIHDINNSGIDAIIGSNQTVTDNVISQCGMIDALCGPGNKANHGMFINGTGSTISGNDVFNIGYVGIDFGGSNLLIENNYVHYWCMRSTDGGGIYTSDERTATNRVVRGNIVTYGIGERGGTPYMSNDNAIAYYFDEASSGVILQNNFAAYCNGGALYLHRATNCTITGNTFVFCTLRTILAAEDSPGNPERITGITFTGNFMYAEAGNLIYSFFGSPEIGSFFTSIDNNILARPGSGSGLIRKLLNYDGATETFYTLASFKAAYPGYDVNSTGTPSGFGGVAPITSINTTASPVTIPLDGIYKSLKGVTFDEGSVTVAPYSAEVLVKTGELIVNTSIHIRGRINYINF